MNPLINVQDPSHLKELHGETFTWLEHFQCNTKFLCNVTFVQGKHLPNLTYVILSAKFSIRYSTMPNFGIWLPTGCCCVAFSLNSSNIKKFHGHLLKLKTYDKKNCCIQNNIMHWSTKQNIWNMLCLVPNIGLELALALTFDWRGSHMLFPSNKLLSPVLQALKS